MYTWSDKTTFIGEWKKNQSIGLGLTTFTDGQQYISDFVNDKEQIIREAPIKALEKAVRYDAEEDKIVRLEALA